MKDTPVRTEYNSFHEPLTQVPLQCWSESIEKNTKNGVVLEATSK